MSKIAKQTIRIGICRTNRRACTGARRIPGMRTTGGWDGATHALSRTLGDFHETTPQPAMGNILVNAGMPHRNHVEAGNLDRRFEKDQSLAVLAKQTRWDECNKVVRQKDFRRE